MDSYPSLALQSWGQVALWEALPHKLLAPLPRRRVCVICLLLGLFIIHGMAVASMCASNSSEQGSAAVAVSVTSATCLTPKSPNAATAAPDPSGDKLKAAVRIVQAACSPQRVLPCYLV